MGFMDHDAGCRPNHQWQKLIDDIFAVHQFYPLEERKPSSNTFFSQTICFLAVRQVA
jgi:hypothetical protein